MHTDTYSMYACIYAYVLCIHLQGHVAALWLYSRRENEIEIERIIKLMHSSIVISRCCFELQYDPLVCPTSYPCSTIGSLSIIVSILYHKKIKSWEVGADL